MAGTKELALTICEKLQNEYPKNPLEKTMLEIEDLINKHIAKQLRIDEVSHQRELVKGFVEFINPDLEMECGRGFEDTDVDDYFETLL